MTLAEMRRLAEESLDSWASGDLARAVLDLLPVVEAAERWREYWDQYTTRSIDLRNAVDTLRGKERP